MIPRLTEYQQGWHDCRTYAGEDAGRSSKYRRGFADCLRAYHSAMRWDGVPRLPPTNAGGAA